MTETSTPHLLPPGLPAPVPTAVDAPFWEATRRHELAVQRCPDCGAFQFPPEELCQRCGDATPDWVVVEGRGTLHSWSRVWHAAHPALTDGVPYLIAVVSLAVAPEVRVFGNLVGPVDRDPTIDGPVAAVYEDHDGFTLVHWQPV